MSLDFWDFLGNAEADCAFLMNENRTHLDLFSGIGGFALAARNCGIKTVAFCEIEPYCQKVLIKNFGSVMADTESEREGSKSSSTREGILQSDGKGKTLANAKCRKVDEQHQQSRGHSKSRRDTVGQRAEAARQANNESDSDRIDGCRPLIFGDIRQLDGKRFRGVWLLTGGFPCQPFSVAGKQRGAADDRFLWPEMLRVIAEARPTWVLGENVAGIINMELDRVLSDLENLGYSAWPIIIPACAVDAKHRRDRVWIVCHAEHTGLNATEKPGSDKTRTRSRTSGSKQTSQSTGSGEQYAPVADANETGRREQRRTEPIQEKHTATEYCRPSLANTFQQQRNGGGNRPCRWEREPQEALRDAWREGRKEDGLSIPESLLGRVADGIPRRVDRLKGLGNAIVPQVSEQIIKAMIQTESPL
jgi:DNA (cytosine-5)-methyltransferase 1